MPDAVEAAAEAAEVAEEVVAVVEVAAVVAEAVVAAEPQTANADQLSRYVRYTLTRNWSGYQKTQDRELQSNDTRDQT